MDILEAVKNGQFEWNFYWKLDYLWRLHLSRGRRLYLPFKLIYKLFQFLFIGLGLFFSNLFSCFLGVALRHGIVRLQITKLINKSNCRVWISSFNVNIQIFFNIYLWRIRCRSNGTGDCISVSALSCYKSCERLQSGNIFWCPPRPWSFHLSRSLRCSLQASSSHGDDEIWCSKLFQWFPEF